MSEHYPKKITETLGWCNRCGKQTMHRVSGGKMTHCLEHLQQELTKMQQRKREKREKHNRQGKLF